MVMEGKKKPGSTMQPSTTFFISVSQNQAFISLYASSNNLEAVWPKYLLELTITATYSFVRIQRFIKILVPCLFGNILFGATTPNAG